MALKAYREFIFSRPGVNLILALGANREFKMAGTKLLQPNLDGYLLGAN